MSGYCDVDFSYASDSADTVEFHTVIQRTARKAHACSECKEQIQPGEPYTRIAYKFDGRFSMDKRCASCAEVAREFEYYIFGGTLWSEMREQWEQGANVQGCIAQLTSARSKELMRRKWQTWKGLEEAPPSAVTEAGPPKKE